MTSPTQSRHGRWGNQLPKYARDRCQGTSKVRKMAAWPIRVDIGSGTGDVEIIFHNVLNLRTRAVQHQHRNRVTHLHQTTVATVSRCCDSFQLGFVRLFASMVSHTNPCSPVPPFRWYGADDFHQRRPAYQEHCFAQHKYRQGPHCKSQRHSQFDHGELRSRRSSSRGKEWRSE